MNALFYNLHTKEIEDFTGRGLDDMAKKLIRTPLEPLQTFNDDPLRVLRLIRFASRLDFIIVPEVKEAMRDIKIQKALRMKISRERIGVEVEKMLRGRDPRLSLSLIHHLGLYSTIFSSPHSDVPADLDPDIMYTAANILFLLEQDPTYEKLMACFLQNAEESYQAWSVVAVMPWLRRELPYIDDLILLKNKTPKPMNAVTVTAKCGLKCTTELADAIDVCAKNLDSVQAVVKTNSEAPLGRGQLGSNIRKWGPKWRLQVFCGMLDEMIPLCKSSLGKSLAEATGVISKYSSFITHVHTEGLQTAYEWRPLLNGNELADMLLPEGKKGAWLQMGINAGLEWQFKNPKGTKEEFIKWIEEGGLAWVVEEAKKAQTPPNKEKAKKVK